jgi:hypothetical protein
MLSFSCLLAPPPDIKKPGLHDFQASPETIIAVPARHRAAFYSPFTR